MFDLVAFGAHPDDVEIGCAGLLIKMGRRGYRTAVVDLTRGEMATSGDPATRAREAEEAARVMGCAERRNLGLPDGALCHTDRAQAEAAVRELRSLRASVVVVPFPHCSHPDHVEAGLLLARAAHLAALPRWGGSAEIATRPAEGTSRPAAVLFYESRLPLVPTFLVDVSAEAEEKRRAIACHRSQFERAAGGPPTGVNDPAFLASFELRARWLGSTLGVAYAEPFVCRSPLAVDDPVALFRSVPGPSGRPQGL